MSAHSTSGPQATGGSPAEQAIGAAITQPLLAIGVDLESVSITKAGRRELVRVVVDRDGGVDLDTVAEVSRLVSDLLDGPELGAHLPGAFVLEVTSPGVDRPLTQPRHWRRAIGRLVDVRLNDVRLNDVRLNEDVAGGGSFIGRVQGVPDDTHAVLEVDGEQRPVAFADVRSAVVQVEFNATHEPGVAAEADE